MKKNFEKQFVRRSWYQLYGKKIEKQFVRRWVVFLYARVKRNCVLRVSEMSPESWGKRIVLILVIKLVLILITKKFKRQELVLILSHYGNQIREKIRAQNQMW